MKPSAIRIERMLEKLEATLVSRPRPYLRVIIHEGDDEAAAMEKALACPPMKLPRAPMALPRRPPLLVIAAGTPGIEFRGAG
jgi:hypothetical protein